MLPLCYAAPLLAKYISGQKEPKFRDKVIAPWRNMRRYFFSLALVSSAVQSLQPTDPEVRPAQELREDPEAGDRGQVDGREGH